MRQRGFTLIELLVAMAVSSLMLSGILVAFHEVVIGNIRARSQTVALNDVNFAAARIKEAIMMGQITSLTDGDPVPRSSLTLWWVDYTLYEDETQTSHSITYTQSGTKLLRDYDGTVSIEGRHITSIGFTQSGRLVTCNITSTDNSAQQRSKTLSFSLRMRSDMVQ